MEETPLAITSPGRRCASIFSDWKTEFMLVANAAKEAPLLLPVRRLRYQDRTRIVFDCPMANDPTTINGESTNENNTDVDRWADARRLRINEKSCSKPWRCLNLPARFAGPR
jgi:hypothetical protein